MTTAVKKYSISWHTSQQKVLQLNFLDNLRWAELLSAILEVLEIARPTPREVTLYIYTPDYKIESESVGDVMNYLFRRLPKAPKVLRRIIVLPSDSQRGMLRAGLETVANLFLGQKFLQVVGTAEEAERLIKESK